MLELTLLLSLALAPPQTAPQSTPKAASPGPSASAEPSPPVAARSGLLVGTLTKLDVARRSAIVVTTTKDKTPTEVEVFLVPASRLVSRGREVKFEDLKLDAKVTVTWQEEKGRRNITLLRVR